jgi:SNF2 family DNA or RNA helicase
LTAISNLLHGGSENSLENNSRGNSGIKKVLIIAPLRVAKNTWPTEIEKWSHLQNLGYSIAVGNEKERKKALEKETQIYIINRENVEWLVHRSGFKFDFDMIVIDELSSFKNHRTQRFKALKKVRPKVKRIVGLTGTPASNSLMDLWAEIGILDWGKRLGRYITHFRNEYFSPDERDGMQVFTYKPIVGAEDKIYEKISDITISMKNTDLLNLPEVIYSEVKVKLSENEMRLYKDLKKNLIVSIKDNNGNDDDDNNCKYKEIDAVNAAALSNKLLQMANGAVYCLQNESYCREDSFQPLENEKKKDRENSERKENEEMKGENKKETILIHNRKLDALEDLIESANGKSVLIAYWFKHDLERIKKRLEILGIGFLKLDSPQSINLWNKRELPIALIHPASAGHGLNLQEGGSSLIWFGLTWSLELYQQTNARLWRQGQKDTVVIQHIVSGDTIDEDVMRALKRKDKVQNELIDAVKARIAS